MKMFCGAVAACTHPFGAMWSRSSCATNTAYVMAGPRAGRQRTVQSHMLDLRHNCEIGGVIIPRITIDVMNNLRRQQWSPERFLHHLAMCAHCARTGDGTLQVRRRGKRSSRFRLAGDRAVFSLVASWMAKCLPAMRARRDHRVMLDTTGDRTVFYASENITRGASKGFPAVSAGDILTAHLDLLRRVPTPGRHQRRGDFSLPNYSILAGQMPPGGAL